MSDTKIPLTSAEQMQRIRNAVHGGESMPQDALALLAGYFSQTNGVRNQIQYLESNMLLKEPPAGSRAPLIGPLLHRLRAFWSRVFMRWYVVPMMMQQNQFNMAATQTLREIVAGNESLTGLIKEMNMRLSKLERNLNTLQKDS